MSSFTNLRTFATLPKTTRGQHIVIGGDPKGKNFLYCNNNSVIIRGVEDPTVVDIYTEHAVQTNVAKYSPSGFYIASGGIQFQSCPFIVTVGPDDSQNVASTVNNRLR